MEDSLKKRYSIKLFANVFTVIIGAFIIAIVPKALGPVAYGQFIYLQEFFMKIIGFLDMGSSIAFFTKLSAKHTRKELITFYFIYSLFVLIFILSFLLTIDFIGYSQLILPNISNEYIYLGLFFGFFTWFTQVFIKISDAYALTVSVELIKIAHKIISLLLLIYFVYFTAFDLNAYFDFLYISLISFVFILSWLFIKKGIFDKSILNINFGFNSLLKEFIEYVSPLLVNSIIVVLVGLFDIWLLQYIAGSAQLGFYGLAYGIVAMCFVFTSAMTPIIMREFAKSYEQKDLEHIRRLFFRYIPMLYSLAAFFGVFISFQNESLLFIFTDEKFKDASLVLAILAFYPLYQTYGQLSGSIFYAAGQTKLIRNISFISQPIGLLLSFVFIYLLEYEAAGLGLKLLITALITVNIQLYLNSKFLNFKMKYFIWHQTYSVLFFVLFAYLSSNIISIDSQLISFFVSGFIYTIFVIIFTYLFPQIFATTKEEIHIYLKRVISVVKK